MECESCARLNAVANDLRAELAKCAGERDMAHHSIGVYVQRAESAEHDLHTEKACRIAAENRAESAEAKVAEARAVLERVEWVSPPTIGACRCPLCLAPHFGGHSPDCALAKVLGRTTK